MSIRRRWSTARRSARLSCARISSALERSSCEASPPICRSISPTIRWVDSRCRSRLVSSSFTSCTWPCSRSRCRWSRSRSARISSNRRRLSSNSGVPCAWSGWSSVMETITRRRGRRSRRGRKGKTAAADFCALSALSALLRMSKMPPHTHQTAGQPKQHAEDDNHHHVLRAEEHEARQRTPALITKQEVAGVTEDQGEESTQQPLQCPLQEKGPADKPIGGAH